MRCVRRTWTSQRPKYSSSARSSLTYTNWPRCPDPLLHWGGGGSEGIFSFSVGISSVGIFSFSVGISLSQEIFFLSQGVFSLSHIQLSVSCANYPDVLADLELGELLGEPALEGGAGLVLGRVPAADLHHEDGELLEGAGAHGHPDRGHHRLAAQGHLGGGGTVCQWFATTCSLVLVCGLVCLLLKLGLFCYLGLD